MSDSSASSGVRPTRERSIETLRGLACILVVMLHSPGMGEIHLRLDGGPWPFAFELVGYLRMPLFTFLSGYVYAMRPVAVGDSPVRFLRAKSRRLLLPMVILGTVYILAFDLIPGWWTPIPGWTSTVGLRPPWTWHVVPVLHFWFVWAIFWCFLAVAFFDSRGWLSRRKSMLTVLAVTFVASSVLPKGNYTLGSILGALYLSVFFLAAIACRRFDWRGVAHRWHLTALGAFLVALSATVVLTTMGTPPSVHGPIGNLLGVLWCMLLILVPFSFRPLAWIGARSYAIFMFHVFPIQLWRVLLNAVGMHDPTVSILSTTIVALLGSIALERLFLTNRVTRFLALGQRWTPRPAPAAHSHGTPSPRPLHSDRPSTERIGDP